MNYAFLDYGQELHADVINGIQLNSEINISFLLTTVKGHFYGNEIKCLKLLDEIKNNNKDIVHKTINDFLFIDNYSQFISVPWVIDESQLLASKHIESMSMRLMDRSALVPSSSFSRRRIYLVLLNYFSYIIESKNIEGVVVFDTPHSFFSHIFFELCKAKNINILKLEYHFLTDYSVVLNQDKWPSIPEDYKKDLTVNELKESLPNNLVKQVFKNSEILETYKSKETKAIVKQSVFSFAKLYVRYLDKAIKNLIMGVFPFFFKKEVLHFSSLNGIKNRLWYRLVLNKQLWKLIKLNVHYNKIANKDLSFNENYVFVGLHMQPEKTSQPMGGEFDNQLMMIKILSDSVPENWKVYVKEHPNQFNVRKVPNRHYRDVNFYDLVEVLPNTEFVPLEIDSEVLIANAKMVSTLTGTLGWEAIIKNIPALVFGKTYYMSCGAVRLVDSVDKAKKAIEELQTLKENDFEIEIYKYLSYYYENNWLVKASNWQFFTSLNSLSYKEQIDNIVNRMVYFINKI